MMSIRLMRLMQSLARSAAQPGCQAWWQPAADVYRGGDGWLVKFDLAGVRPDELQIAVSGRWLTVRGLRRDRAIGEGRQVWSMEISYNRFQRSIELPCELDEARVTTEYRDGMLLVRLTTGGEP